MRLCCPHLPVLRPARTSSRLPTLSSEDLWVGPSPGFRLGRGGSLLFHTLPCERSVPRTPERPSAASSESSGGRCVLPSLAMNCSALSAFRLYNLTRLQDSLYGTDCSLAQTCRVLLHRGRSRLALVHPTVGLSPGSYGRISASQLRSATGLLRFCSRRVLPPMVRCSFSGRGITPDDTIRARAGLRSRLTKSPPAVFRNQRPSPPGAVRPMHPNAPAAILKHDQSPSP